MITDHHIENKIVNQNMHSLSQAMVRYVRSVNRVLCSSISIIGLSEFIKVMLFGVLGKVSVISSFIITIKSVAFVLHSYPHDFQIALIDYSIEYSSLIWLLFISVPIVFGLAGILIYFGHKINLRYIELYIKEMRKNYINKKLDAVSLENMSENDKKKLLGELLNQNDPKTRRTARDILTGCLDGVQCIIIIFFILISLLLLDLEIFVLVSIVMIIGVPCYIKLNFNINRGRQKIMENIVNKKNKQRQSIIRKPIIKYQDELEIKKGIEEYISDDNENIKTGIEMENKLASRKPMPLIYFLLGIVLSYMLWDMVGAGMPVSTRMVGDFIIIVLLLRFLASIINTALNAIRLINREYANITLLYGLV